ncbi:Cacna1b [Symbiodinium pilosum]|uniref:Cacna1b protein n=1 Tax=Symbiodinium pilosum TaxID=2952 RepID=A0A812N8S0_SYMPI|nr:Cacna1b [Symbiodinium pilosum]
MRSNKRSVPKEVDAKTLMNRKLQQHLEEMNVPGEEERIGDFESIETLLGNQMEEVYMQLQLHYSTAIRLLAHRDSMARRYQEEIERLKSQLDALKSASAKEKEAKQMKILISQVKLYKDKYLERDKTARAIEVENYELREQLSALRTVGVSYAYSQADSSMIIRPSSPHSPPSKPEPLPYAAYGAPAGLGPIGDPLDRLEKAQLRLDSWASQNRASVKRNLTGLINVQDLPTMELPGEITTRGAYGPAPPIMPELEDEKPKEEEDEQQAEEDEPPETAYYIRASKNRLQEEETGLGWVMQKLRGYMQAFFFQGERDMQDTYYKTGLCQFIARSQSFEHATMAVIAANSVWLGVDVTWNDQLLLINSEPVFIVMENLFCTYFFLEIVIRFGAFRRKCNVFRDYWFVFDLALVLAMILDTWVLLAIMAASDTDVSVINSSSLRLLRIIRISRLARVARILRSVPEMMILFQGMGVASRSVICTVSLLVILVYVFALVFMQLLRGTSAGDAYFPSIAKGMFALFFHGCLGEQLPDLAAAVFDEGIDVGLFLIIFVFLGPLTVMNMVVAVLVHVVSSVATLQHKNQQNGVIRERIYNILKNLDGDDDDVITQEEFRMILDRKEAMAVFLEVGVDVIAILKDPDIIFGGEVRLPIDELLDEVITLRGSNFTTVKDLVQLKNQLVRELRRFGQRRQLL